MPKLTRAPSDGAERRRRHAPLGHVMEADRVRAKYATPSKRAAKDEEEDEDEEEEFWDEAASKRILDLSREQQWEMERERLQEARRKAATALAKRDSDEAGAKRPSGHPNKKDHDDDDDDDASVDSSSMAADNDDDDDEEYDELVERDEAGCVTIVENAPGLSAADEAVVASMMGNNGEERRTLADIIMEKIREKEEEALRAARGDDDNDNNDDGVALPPKVVEVYTEIGKILSRYTSGKLPKALKVIPALSQWEEVLYLTRPDRWTPQAMYAATRIFASNLNPQMAQRFYHLVLLDSVRADIVENGRLDYHYFMALKKAVYKPAAFFKGILLPLCRDGGCTLREAAIVSAVVQRVSIPVHHSAVAIHKLAQMEYSGAAAVFLKTLLQKKYALPAPVIQSVVHHFAQEEEEGERVVLWHQCLLVFCQRYKHALSDEARETLKRVLKKHFHSKMTPEIRRELFGAQAWNEERAAAAAAAKDNDMEL